MLAWIDAFAREAGWVGLVGLALAAGLEYVIPPFPGDSVVVLGGVYAVRSGTPVTAVFAAVMLGSLGGATFDWALGVRIGRRLAAAPPHKHWLRFLEREQILAWEERFRRRGTWWLLLNRFLPGVRGPIFFAAGLSNVPYRRVLLWGGLSSFAWNALLFGAGYAAGGQADRLEHLVRDYSRIAWAALAVVAAFFVVRSYLRRTRVPPPSGGAGKGTGGAGGAGGAAEGAGGAAEGAGGAGSGAGAAGEGALDPH